jgi:hypothetical protein
MMTGFQTQVFMLAKQTHYCLNHTSSPFFSGYFGDGGLVNYFPGHLKLQPSKSQPPKKLGLQAGLTSIQKVGFGF